MYDRFTVKRHGEAHCPGNTGGIVGGAFLRAQVAAATIVARRQLMRHLLFTHLIESLWRAITAIGVSRRDQLMSILLVERPALCLIVWPERTANQRPLVVIHAKPLKDIQQTFN